MRWQYTRLYSGSASQTDLLTLQVSYGLTGPELLGAQGNGRPVQRLVLTYSVLFYQINLLIIQTAPFGGFHTPRK